MSQTMTLYCAGCRTDSEFERPPCADGHGTDCPDLVCTWCGLALFAFVADEAALADARIGRSTPDPGGVFAPRRDVAGAA